LEFPEAGCAVAILNEVESTGREPSLLQAPEPLNMLNLPFLTQAKSNPADLAL